MALITLVGKKMAKEGNEFIYLGINEICRSCRLKTVCSNLQEGRTYRIVKVRDKTHECPLHEEGVVVVEVEKLPIEVNIKKEEAEATAVSFHPVKCDRVLCEEYDACVPGIKEKDYRIVEVLGDVKCPRNLSLTKVLIDDIK